MRRATLTRRPSTDDGTFGDIETDSGYTCCSGELPDRGNAPDRSCIPVGTYRVKLMWSEKHKKNLWHVLGVPGRTVIEIHSANLMGDVEKGKVSQLLGCIAPGEGVALFAPGSVPGLLKHQWGVNESGKALAALMKDLGEEFDLEIRAKTS